MNILDSSVIQNFLQSHFDARAGNAALIGTGMFSQAFAFSVAQQKFVVRVSECLDDFHKDRFARAHFASSALPIPNVLNIGKFDAARYFCITEFCAGRTLHDTHNAADVPFVPQLFLTLDAIHAIDVSSARGFGLADANSNGKFASWHDALLTLDNQKFAYTFDAPFFEQNVFDEFYRAMQTLLPACSNERYLIHRDYGFDNVIVNDTRIVAVLDWAEFGYGDFLYDVAYLDYFSQQIPFGDLWHARQRNIPNFQARMQCYMLNIGLHDLAIAATLKRERAYIRARERLRSVLLPSRRAPTDWTQ